MTYRKADLLKKPIQHIDIKKYNVVALVDAMGSMAFQARNTYRAAEIYKSMIKDKGCAIILTLAGSLVSAGLKKVIIDLIENNMVDVVVSTGANIFDQDFFEGIGFHHYVGTSHIDDAVLQKFRIDRIYDTFIDEDELRICDEKLASLFNSMEPRVYSSREVMIEVGEYLYSHGKTKSSIILACYKKEVPIFIPAFADSSAGFGLVSHQWNNRNHSVAVDSGKDFLELTRIKLANPTTGIFMIGGGVPKNFTQDIVVSADVLGFKDVAMHKYALQITTADERDGGLSGSTLKEALSWGKVEANNEQIVYGEASVTFPLIASYAYHSELWKQREGKKINQLFQTEALKKH